MCGVSLIAPEAKRRSTIDSALPSVPAAPIARTTETQTFSFVSRRSQEALRTVPSAMLVGVVAYTHRGSSPSTGMVRPESDLQSQSR